MAKVQTLLVLTLIVAVQMYEMDESLNGQSNFGDNRADFQGDLENEAGFDMYQRLVKRNGPIWRPRFFKHRGFPGYRMEEDSYISNNDGGVVGNGPWRGVQSVKTYKVHNGPWKVKKVSMTSNGDNVEPDWIENNEPIVKPFSTINGGQMMVDVDDPEDIAVRCKYNVMPVEKEIPLGPIQYFMDNRKRDVAKQAYSKDQKQERVSSKPVDEIKGQVNRIRMTIKPDRKLNKQNSLKTGVTKTT